MSVNVQKRKADVGSFGERLQRRRIEKGMSQGDLARAIGIHQNQIGRYERGDSQPTADKIKKLCDALGVSKDYLLDGAEEGAARANFDDVEMLELFQEVQTLTDEDKKAIKKFVRLYVNNAKISAMTAAAR
ncbi:helix-turn-helix domain-containing protein [Leptonema illini]|uniref:Helix-turn-helix domain protein n=1 Tax=Leptonema illini DSM 21528 TaxID=929563 RepID=H2CLL4_9LEPT|nr:helix-turn-helix transcriptional regulator [Leptonema illini]EHQ04625.1 helix-turn-helix domain protein [Leptonema illini DSM 21528]